MSKNEVNNRKAKRDYLSTWIENFGQAEELIPRIQKELEKTDWEIEALDNAPEESDEIPMGDMSKNFNVDYEHMTHVLPMLPRYNADQFMGATGISASGTASVYEFVSRVGDLGTEQAIEYSNQYTQKYQVIQSDHNRLNDVRMHLAKFHNQDTLDRFDRAAASYAKFKASVGERTASADRKSVV
jgi:hypothetical protein